MSLPRVTVVIPTHRRPQWLAEALASVARQRYAPLQVIVVEDGADPATASVIAAAEVPVEHLTVPHAGLPGLVRNCGLERATGEFVAFLDDDDRWEEGKLTRQVTDLVAHPHAPASYTNARIENVDGQVVGSFEPPPRARRLSTRSALLGGCFLYPSSMLVRRAALNVAGGFDATMRSSEDYALWLRLSRLGDFIHLEAPLVTIRRHGTGLSTAPRADIWINTIAVLDAERKAGGLTVGDRLRLRRVLGLGFMAIGQSLPPKSYERRRMLWKAFRLYPFQRGWWRLPQRWAAP